MKSWTPLVFLFLGENREILTVRKREDHKRERDNMRDEVLLSADPVEPEANSTSSCLRFHYKPISLHFKKKFSCFQLGSITCNPEESQCKLPYDLENPESGSLSQGPAYAFYRIRVNRGKNSPHRSLVVEFQFCLPCILSHNLDIIVHLSSNFLHKGIK